MDSWSKQTDSTQVLASNTISNKRHWLLREVEDSRTEAGNTQMSLEYLVRPRSVQKTTHNDGIVKGTQKPPEPPVAKAGATGEQNKAVLDCKFKYKKYPRVHTARNK